MAADVAKFGRRLVFFLYTSLEISPKLGYILYVCALARLISASSKEKILRLIFVRVVSLRYTSLRLKFARLHIYIHALPANFIRASSSFAILPPVFLRKI